MIKGNRTTNIVLIIFLVIIWFFVIKKAFFQEIPISNVEESYIDNDFVEKAEILEKKTIALSDLNNPFLNTLKGYKKVENSSSLNRVNTSKIKNIEKPISWPILSYYGYVGKNNGKNLQALIKCDNKLIKMKVGDQFQKIKLKKLSPDSVVISMENIVKTIRRKG